MNEHSPGPWTWHDFYGSFELRDRNGEAVLDDGSACGEYSQTINPNSANGRLVAIAPEMLSLLKRLRSWDHMATAGDGPYWCREIDALLSKAGATP